MNLNIEDAQDLTENSATEQQINGLEGQFSSLSIQVLTMVSDRVRRAFGGSSPVSIPRPISEHFKMDPATLRVTRKNSAHLLSTTPNLVTDSDQLPVFTLDDVSYHETSDDCWVIIYDRVYDVTNFLSEHPGGDEVLLEYAGRDCTLPFRSSGHSKWAEDALEPYLIGILPEHERLWSNNFGPRHER